MKPATITVERPITVSQLMSKYGLQENLYFAVVDDRMVQDKTAELSIGTKVQLIPIVKGGAQ